MDYSCSYSELTLDVSRRLLTRLEQDPNWPAFLRAWPRAGVDATRLRAAVEAARHAPPHARDAALARVAVAFDGLACALTRFNLTPASPVTPALEPSASPQRALALAS